MKLKKKILTAWADNNKGIVLVMLIVFIVSSFFATKTINANEPIEISSCQELQDMNLDLDEEYVLAHNIDCSEASEWNDGDGFLPIGNSSNPFVGILDGNNNTITGLYINRPTGQHDIGLFGVVNSGANIHDLNLEEINITGAGRVGGLAGRVFGTSEILNISIGGEIRGNGTVGGLIGIKEGGSSVSITNISIDADIFGLDYTGGLLGESMDNIDISGVTVRGEIKGRDSVGGLIGFAYFNTNSKYLNVIDSDVYATITSTSEITFVGTAGGLIGESSLGNNGSTLISNSNFFGEITRGGYSVGGFFGYSRIFTSGTFIVEDSQVGGTEEYVGIDGGSYVGGLFGFSDLYSSSIVNGEVVGLEVKNTKIYTDITANDYVGGMFGYSSISSAKNSILNFEISENNIYGSIEGEDDDIGGLVGYLYITGRGSQELNISNNSIALDMDGGNYLGGLIGSMELDIDSDTEDEVDGSVNFSIEKNSYLGNITAIGETGGFIANMGIFTNDNSSLDLDIINNYSQGGINGGDTSGGFLGDVGVNQNDTSFYSIRIANNYSSVDVVADDEIGGFIGNLEGIVSEDVGGSASLVIENNFSAGVLGAIPESNPVIGGFIGHFNFDEDTISLNNNYFDISRSSQSECLGSLGLDVTVGMCAGVNETNSSPNYFKGNSTNPPLNVWNFNTVWQTVEDDYPIFGSGGDDEDTFIVTASASSGGTITPSGSIEVVSGSNQTFTITPSSGYTTSTVLINGINNSNAVSAGSYTFINVTTNHTISATFSRNVSSSSGGGGSSSGKNQNNILVPVSLTSPTSTPEVCSSTIYGLVTKGLVKKGSRGINAKGVQLAVNQLKVTNTPLAVDSIIGSKSDSGIRLVQTKVGTKVDGLWGSLTQGMYESFVKGNCVGN